MRQHIQKTTDSGTRRFSYDLNGQLLSRMGDRLSRDVVWMDRIPVAMVDTKEGKSSICYITADGLGTPRVLTDASGKPL